MNRNEIAVLNILNQRRGKPNVITYSELAGQVGLSGRALRYVVRGLILDHNVPICTSYDRDRGGYYIARTVGNCGRRYTSSASTALKS